jgi:hypothetical protein
LMKANFDARLPSDDWDLHFRFSQLRPPGQNYVRPAALLDKRAFKPLAEIYNNGTPVCTSELEYMPSALRIKVDRLGSEPSAGSENNPAQQLQKIAAYATAETTAAQPEF